MLLVLIAFRFSRIQYIKHLLGFFYTKPFTSKSVKRSTNDDIVCIIFDRMRCFCFFFFVHPLACGALELFLFLLVFGKLVGVPHFYDSAQQPIRKLVYEKSHECTQCTFRTGTRTLIIRIKLSFSHSFAHLLFEIWLLSFFFKICCMRLCVCIFLKIQHFSVFPFF